MSDNDIEDIKGRTKEAAGAITGDEELKREGQLDQQAAGVKEKIDKVADKVKDGVHDIKSRLTGSD